MFLQDGYEVEQDLRPRSTLENFKEKREIEGAYANIERASRRAKINAFDFIMSNADLDTFGTFTFRPDEDVDRSNYDDCYNKLKTFLSNRVQRNGLKYIVVPEHHKSGDIHFHGIMNSGALKLARAHSPAGRAITQNGQAVYNITDWRAGFSTAKIIGKTDEDRVKVAKYIFKYMGKQMGQKIGGRYCLIGGADMQRPRYIYADEIEEIPDYDTAVYSREVNVSSNLNYKELSFL